MAAAVDLEGPLQDLIARTQQLRAIMALVEISARSPQTLAPSARQRIDMSHLGGMTTNTANSMCIVFLAASFEEFFRELVSQCGVQMSESYADVPMETKLVARNSYWEACLDSLRFNRRILTKQKPKKLDVDAVSKARAIIESARSFVMLDDGSTIDGKIFYHHGRNYRPIVVDEIAARLGVKGIVKRSSDSNRLRRHFGVTTMAEVESRLVTKLDSFYQTRNEIVHSLNSSTGFAVGYVNDHIELIEGFSESLKNVLQKHIGAWVPAAA